MHVQKYTFDEHESETGCVKITEKDRETLREVTHSYLKTHSHYCSLAHHHPSSIRAVRVTNCFLLC